MTRRNDTTKPKRVALIIESMMAPRRGMMNGIARYTQEHEAWAIYLKPSYVDSNIRSWIDHWNGDGIIGNVATEQHDSLIGVNVPIVDLFGEVSAPGIPIVRANDAAIGRLGAEHLMACGFRHFAFCELADRFWSRRRRVGFEERLNDSGFECFSHLSDKPSATLAGPEKWEQEQSRLANWIESLPKPIGIMTTTDFLGRQLLEACMRIDVHVPDEVAVLGVDDDEPICRIAWPPLSSVILNDEQRGYEAAAVLADLMAGRPAPKKPVLIEPTGVRTRASTDVYAIGDETMVGALRYLREHVDEHTDIDALAERLDISRSALERKFRRVLGRTLNEEVVRLRLNQAVRLLAETQLPLKAVAARCGFSSQAYMTTVFKNELGRTPGSYRRENY